MEASGLTHCLTISSLAVSVLLISICLSAASLSLFMLRLSLLYLSLVFFFSPHSQTETLQFSFLADTCAECWL